MLSWDFIVGMVIGGFLTLLLFVQSDKALSFLLKLVLKNPLEDEYKKNNELIKKKQTIIKNMIEAHLNEER